MHRPGRDLHGVPFSELRGMTVENPDGDELGVFKGLILDMRSGQCRYALISSGGFPGLRSRRRLVPVALLSDATAKTRTLQLDITASTWKDAPLFKTGDLTRLEDDKRRLQIARYFRTVPQDERLASAVIAPGASVRSNVTATGDGAGRRQGAAVKLQFAGELVGRAVVDAQSKPLGKISDLLIDLTGTKSCLALLEVQLDSGNRRVFVPLGALRLGHGKSLQLDASPAELDRAPELTERAWRKLRTGAGPVIYHVAD